MFQNVKLEKVKHLKNLKRITIEKTSLMKKEKAMKEKNAELRQSLDQNMPAYAALQTEYDTLKREGRDTEEVSQQMSDLLQRIETDRQKFLERQEALKKVRQRLKELEDAITLERAELVATAGILDQNDKLRLRIQEEERDKARVMIESELAEARAQLDREREGVRGTLEADFRQQLSDAWTEAREYKAKYQRAEKEREALQRQEEESQRRVDDLRDKLAEAEALSDAYLLETEALNNDKQQLTALLEETEATARNRESELIKQMDELRKETRAQQEQAAIRLRGIIEEEKYQVFRALMDSFQEERQEFHDKIETMRKLLSQATQVRGRWMDG